VGGGGRRGHYYHSWIQVVEINITATKVPVNENAIRDDVIKAVIKELSLLTNLGCMIVKFQGDELKPGA